MKEAVIFDLDGTLCDITHRLKYLDEDSKDIDAFFEAVKYDTPKQVIIDILKKYYNSGVSIIILTSRNSITMNDTKDWLNAHAISYDLLLMRHSENNETSQQFKTNAYYSEIIEEYNVLFAVDDTFNIAKMWRNLGLTCLQCC